MPSNDIDSLIEAFTIFKKYLTPGTYKHECPTHCDHGVMQVGVDPNVVSDEDKKRLDQLSFFGSKEGGDWHFRSYHFGSA